MGDAPLPKEVIDAILAENQRDIEAVTDCLTAFPPVPVFDAWLDSDIHFVKRMVRHIIKELYCSNCTPRRRGSIPQVQWPRQCLFVRY